MLCAQLTVTISCVVFADKQWNKALAVDVHNRDWFNLIKKGTSQIGCEWKIREQKNRTDNRSRMIGNKKKKRKWNGKKGERERERESEDDEGDWRLMETSTSISDLANEQSSNAMRTDRVLCTAAAVASRKFDGNKPHGIAHTHTMLEFAVEKKSFLIDLLHFLSVLPFHSFNFVFCERARAFHLVLLLVFSFLAMSCHCIIPVASAPVCPCPTVHFDSVSMVKIFIFVAFVRL